MLSFNEETGLRRRLNSSLGTSEVGLKSQGRRLSKMDMVWVEGLGPESLGFIGFRA